MLHFVSSLFMNLASHPCHNDCITRYQAYHALCKAGTTCPWSAGVGNFILPLLHVGLGLRSDCTVQLLFSA